MEINNLLSNIKNLPIIENLSRYMGLGVWLNNLQWKAGIIVPLLVNVHQSWESYYQQLSYSGKRNYRRIMRINDDISFIAQLPTSFETITHFINLFEQKHKFAPDSLAKLHSLYNKGWVWTSGGLLQDEIIVLQLAYRYGPYLRGYAVMYDIDRFEKRSLPVWMIFNAIKYAISCPEIDWFDLGYGPLKIYPKSHHKLRYHPEDVPYWLRVCPNCSYMSLFHENHSGNTYHICPNCQYANKFGPKERLIMTLTRIFSQVKAVRAK
jgi:hypothetical protein